MERAKAATGSFKDLGSRLCGRKLVLKQTGRLYKECVRCVLGYGAENWSVDMKELNKIVSTERKILRTMFGITLRDRI